MNRLSHKFNMIFHCAYVFLTWDESVKRDLKDWNISKEIALDRSAWRVAINVPEP